MTLTIRRAALGIFLSVTAAGLLTAPAGAAKLKGTLAINAGTWSSKPAGSWFRLATPTGAYLDNASSTAGNKSYTLLKPGRQRGITLGSYQADSTFADNGDSQADAIITPTAFFGTLFGLATLRVEAPGARPSPAPSATVKGKKISVNLSALTAAWNKQYFNQGLPKPGTKKPLVTGSYSSKSKAFKLDWRSKIAGGPFNGFTGVWHLEGKLR